MQCCGDGFDGVVAKDSLCRCVTVVLKLVPAHVAAGQMDGQSHGRLIPHQARTIGHIKLVCMVTGCADPCWKQHAGWHNKIGMCKKNFLLLTYSQSWQNIANL